MLVTEMPMEIRVVMEDEEERRPRVRKDTSYREVFKLFKNPWPLNWNIRPVEIQAAKNLLEEHGIEEIKDALQFIKDFGHTDFFPSITSPYDLDSKWAKLEAKSKELAKKQ